MQTTFFPALPSDLVTHSIVFVSASATTIGRDDIRLASKAKGLIAWDVPSCYKGFDRPSYLVVYLRIALAVAPIWVEYLLVNPQKI
jgi:hypothetical protein